MGSVSSHFSGTASGINNAITRIANVFANAVFGALAVLFFSGSLQQQVSTKPFSEKDKQVIMAQAADLGNAKVPASINPVNKPVVVKFYKMAFIDTYSRIMQISAALGFLGALMAFVFIKNSGIKRDKRY
jgi:hypothetical protein